MKVAATGSNNPSERRERYSLTGSFFPALGDLLVELARRLPSPKPKVQQAPYPTIWWGWARPAATTPHRAITPGRDWGGEEHPGDAPWGVG